MPSGPSLPRTVADDDERWRWDLNPRTGYPVTRFRVLRTHVQARSPTSTTCSTRPSADVTEPPRTTTNETRTETRSALASSAGLGPQPPTAPMTARRKTWHRRLHCAGATNPVPPGTASVIPAQYGRPTSPTMTRRRIHQLLSFPRAVTPVPATPTTSCSDCNAGRHALAAWYNE
jgi:hypothetical protein